VLLQAKVKKLKAFSIVDVEKPVVPLLPPAFEVQLEQLLEEFVV